MNIVNIKEKFESITEYWDPKIIAELNGQYVKIAKVKGEFVWHKHDNEDELFQVIKGQLKIEFRNETVEFGPGEILVVPKGIEHKPIAKEEVWIMMFEPKSTLNTGDQVNELTQSNLQKI